MIGFLREDLNSQYLFSHVNVLNQENVGSPTPENVFQSMQFKMGGVSFCKAYLFCLKTMEDSLDVLFIGNIVSICVPSDR